jgi:flagellar motor switch protein FliN/FliY
MPDVTVNEILALRDLIANVSPHLAQALAEQIRQGVSPGIPIVETAPVVEILADTETRFATTFSLSAPLSAEIVMSVMPQMARLFVDLLSGYPPTDLSAPLQEPDSQKLASAMQIVARAFATAMSQLTGETVDLESCTSHYGSLIVPPVFALERQAIRVLLNLNLPQLPGAELSFLFIPSWMRTLMGGEEEGAAEIAQITVVPSGQSAAASSDSGVPRDLERLLDIPLTVTVKLGGARLLIRDVISMGTGSILELDRVAGEPVDLLVNGEPIAKGEVVVIDDNFGIRITEIISPAERVNGLGKSH